MANCYLWRSYYIYCTNDTIVIIVVEMEFSNIENVHCDYYKGNAVQVLKVVG